MRTVIRLRAKELVLMNSNLTIGKFVKDCWAAVKLESYLVKMSPILEKTDLKKYGEILSSPKALVIRTN